MIRDTSLDAYFEHRNSGKMSTQCGRIYNAIKNGSQKDYSLQEIVKLTGEMISSVSARCKKMKDDGVLEESESRKCSITGKTVHPVKIKPKQLSLLEAA